jgi:DNA-binding transcriptional LysR family regulator
VGKCSRTRLASWAPVRIPGILWSVKRRATFGVLYAWEFEKDGQELKVRVEGQLVFNNILHVLEAVLEGFGLAHVPEDIAQPHIAEGRLRQVLDDWCPSWPGYHIYYPSRRQASPAFAVVLEALRERK